MKNLFKSFLIGLLCAVGVQNATAQAYPFEIKNEDPAIYIETGPIHLGDSLLETRLEVMHVRSLYPMFLIALTKSELAESNKSALFESIRRLAAQIQGERGSNKPFKATVTLANGNRMEAEGMIFATDDMQAINMNNPLTTRIGFGVKLGKKVWESDGSQIVYDEKVRKTVAQLCSSNIVKFEIAGEAFTFNGLRSADTLREMLKALDQIRQKVGY